MKVSSILSSAFAAVAMIAAGIACSEAATETGTSTGQQNPNPANPGTTPTATSTGTTPTTPPKKDAGVAEQPDPDWDGGLPTNCTPDSDGLYSFSDENLAGTENVPLCRFKNKVLLIVNVASKCGNTPQYTPLEALYEKYRDQGFYILGFPCAQFGNQEFDSGAEISNFCTTEYHITFPMFAKIEVNGPNANPLYVWLKSQPGGTLPGASSSDIDWNFAKFLIGRDGKLIKRWPAGTSPDPSATPEIEQKIIEALAK